MSDDLEARRWRLALMAAVLMSGSDWAEDTMRAALQAAERLLVLAELPDA